MIRTRSKRRTVRWLAASTWMLALAAVGSAALAASPVCAEEAEVELDGESLRKAEWQDRYRVLRNNAARMRENATKLRRAYALAQHANYPRGGARERFKQQVLETEEKAEAYEAELARFEEEARRERIPPGWIYEVEDEPVDLGMPASFADEDEPTHERFAPEGRNPVFYGADEADGDEERADGARGDAYDDDR